VKYNFFASTTSVANSRKEARLKSATSNSTNCAPRRAVFARLCLTFLHVLLG
jgi:hypothetical protein